MRTLTCAFPLSARARALLRRMDLFGDARGMRAAFFPASLGKPCGSEDLFFETIGGLCRCGKIKEKRKKKMTE